MIRPKMDKIRQTHRDRAMELAREMGIEDKLRRYVRKPSQPGSILSSPSSRPGPSARPLSEQQPEYKSHFEAGLATLEKDLTDLDTACEATLASLSDAPLVYSHPVYQYFQRRYRLIGKSVHWEPDEAPTTEQWGELAELLKMHKAKWMIWEDEPTPEVVARLNQLGVVSVVFNPCGNTPETGNYLEVMNANLHRIDAMLAASSDTEN